jgi:apolipoprotein N-acyltransferase
VLLAASFPKFGHPAFAWIALTPLIVAIALRHQGPASRDSRRRTALGAVWLGLIAGAVYFAGTLYWVVTVVGTFGGLSLPVALGVGVLMVASLAIYPAFFAYLTDCAVGRFGVAGVWLTPCCWVASEWLRATVGFAFPWVFLGSSQAEVLPVVQAASVVGVYGLSWLVALVSAAAAAVALSRRRVHLRGAVGVMALLAVVAVLGALRLRHPVLLDQGTPFRVGLVQGDVEQEVKWDIAYQLPIIDRHLQLSRQVLAQQADLVIWPESSTPFYFDLDGALSSPIRQLAAQARRPFLIGTDQLERQRGSVKYYNAAVLLGADGLSHGSYRKMRLVPFGEYVPLQKILFFVGPLVEAVSNFTPGTDPHVFDLGGGRRVSVAICYESVYPWIGRAFVDRGSQLLATITNDGWFGRSSAAYQHFDQAGLRAVEEGRYVVRAANTGISGAVDPYGRIVTATPLFQTAGLVVDVRLLDDRTIYNRLGDLIVWFSLVVSAVVGLWRGRRP